MLTMHKEFSSILGKTFPLMHAAISTDHLKMRSMKRHQKSLESILFIRSGKRLRNICSTARIYGLRLYGQIGPSSPKCCYPICTVHAQSGVSLRTYNTAVVIKTSLWLMMSHIDFWLLITDYLYCDCECELGKARHNEIMTPFSILIFAHLSSFPDWRLCRTCFLVIQFRCSHLTWAWTFYDHS